MIKPKRLKSQSTIGIISPSYWIDENILKQTSEIFTSRDFKLAYGKSIYTKDGPFAGSPELRANDIHEMFLDPSIDAILCARGGYGAYQATLPISLPVELHAGNTTSIKLLESAVQ